MVGGGFGGKEDITVEIYLALLAKHTSRPVRLVYTREESILAHSKRHPYVIRHRTGVTKDGRITAAEIDILSDSGAYPYLSPYVLLYTAVMAPGPYRVENLQIDAVAAATNNPFTSAFRGFGGPQACFAYEQQMDAIADELGMDRLELRCVNYLRTGDTTATGQAIESAAWLEETATRAMAGAGRQDARPLRGPGQRSARASPRTSRATAASPGCTTPRRPGSAWSWMARCVRAGVPDLGAGQINSLCQITAEVLGVPLERISVYATDSALTPLSGTSTATRQLTCRATPRCMAATGGAPGAGGARVASISRKRRERSTWRTAGLCQGRPGAVAANWPTWRKICASEGLPLANLAFFKAPFTDPIDPETGQGRVFPDFTFGAYAVEVAVDTETGEITVLKAAACHDIGRAINRGGGRRPDRRAAACRAWAMR